MSFICFLNPAINSFFCFSSRLFSASSWSIRFLSCSPESCVQGKKSYCSQLVTCSDVPKVSEGQTHKLVSRVTDIWTDRMHSKARDQPTDKQTGSQADRETDRQTDRPTERQRDRKADRHIYTYRRAGRQADRQVGQIRLTDTRRVVGEASRKTTDTMQHKFVNLTHF